MNAPIRSDDFHRLYRSVTSRLQHFVAAGVRAHRISGVHAHGINDPEAAWYQDLIDGFEHEFNGWPNTPSADIEEYLQLFEARKVSSPLRLAAHAFLHVAYDLPRVIAATLVSTPLSQRARLRSLFLRPAPLFRDVFLQHAREGHFGLIARPLGYFKPAEVLGYWVLSLRSVAWIHAETLADSPAPNVLADQLAQGMLAVGKDVRGITTIPKLDNSILFQVAPIALMQAHPVATGLAAAGLALVAGSAIRLRNEVQTKRIAYFGARTYIAATKALQGSEADPPPARMAREFA